MSDQLAIQRPPFDFGRATYVAGTAEYWPSTNLRAAGLSPAIGEVRGAYFYPSTSANILQVHELEPWQRTADSYTDEELDALYADYLEEARQLAEEGIEEYAQRLLELDKA